MTYEQAFKDHQYLWNTYGEPYDMTGGYVDSEDLADLLKSPTKATARKCLISQIVYWFEVGPDSDGDRGGGPVAPIMDEDPEVRVIAERYGCV